MRVCISFERRTREEKDARLRAKLSRQDVKHLMRIRGRYNHLTPAERDALLDMANGIATRAREQ